MATARANVLLVGSPYWCGQLKSLLNKYGSVRCHTIGDAFRWLLAPSKSICLVGVGAPDTGKRFVYHFAAFLLHRLGIVRSRTLYWIGSDVIRLRPNDTYVSGCRNIAGSAWIAEEVRGKGYGCIHRLFPVELRSVAGTPFPPAGRLQVLSYIPDAQHELHGSSELSAPGRSVTGCRLQGDRRRRNLVARPPRERAVCRLGERHLGADRRVSRAAQADAARLVLRVRPRGYRCRQVRHVHLRCTGRHLDTKRRHGCADGGIGALSDRLPRRPEAAAPARRDHGLDFGRAITGACTGR